jgi:hypothetical protein
MKHCLLVLLLVIFSVSASAQQPGNTDPNALNAKFAAQRHEVAVVCGEFLPNQIPGITEMMSLCGGRAGFKIGQKTFLEAQALSGAGRGQRYILGSLNFRGDVQFDDLIGSIYLGGDIHYATQPDYTVSPTSEETNMYFGFHFGGAIWAEITENLYFRTDMQFGLNPGTSLFAGFALVLRFDPGGAGGNEPPPTGQP